MYELWQLLNPNSGTCQAVRNNMPIEHALRGGSRYNAFRPTKRHGWYGTLTLNKRELVPTAVAKSYDDGEVTASIYKAAVLASPWQAVLKVLCDCFGLSNGAIMLPRMQCLAVNGALVFDGELRPEANDVADAMADLADGDVAIRNGGGDANSMLHLLMLNLVIRNEPTLVKLYRSEVPFGTEDAERLHNLGIHIRAAMEIGEQVGQLQNNLSFHKMALNRVSVGLVIIGERDQIIWTNETADRIGSGCDGLSINAGKLYCERAADNTKLWSLIKAARVAHDTTFAANFWRPGAERDWSVMVIANPEHSNVKDGTVPDIGVFIRDTSNRATLDPKVLKELFSFTNSEIRLAISLTAGANVEEAANELGIKLATVRVHLRSMFGKVGVHRQSELMRRILV